MGTSLDGLTTPSSLSQRRQAAFSLELPPPNTLQFNPVVSSQKFPPLSGINTSQAGPPPINVGQLLTPPSNSASDSSAASSAIPTGTTPNSAAAPVLPYTPTLFGTGNTTTGYHTGFTPPSWQNGSLVSARSMFSPMPGASLRNSTNSPTAGETTALPPPPYDLHPVQPYGASLQLSSPTSATHPTAQQSIITPLPTGVRPPSQQSPVTPGDGVSRAASNPALYTTMTTAAQQHPGYHYPSATPVSQSPHPHSLSAPRVSPPLHQGPQPQVPFMRPPPPSYSLPAMPGPIMSNVHSPSAQMAMVGNMQPNMLPMAFNSGYAANPHTMYGQQRSNTPQQQPAHDRPFKCDQCPQSFNRNHDLKRHKRIHLAVKPFPCSHCDKSFSRKDALKRHILVKGCGTGKPPETATREDGVKSESGSDGVNESPAAATAA
ncbi:uncharacterized protein Z519_02093 [Cladophialophora bantiana CBS 173.52]|uniref:C2H2-type domain-containing protein n=1 Tax=Cladophialophora bantiana (strain ATCC 10958 / CBS 173.52 / CDC B-1940 / NIH 8579) TaxID=1442370 RepID=A0A0D2GE83_CLAB1|nr:uncharacterized protein Z519_02093 [Cladophialophora bantiana CBS 173.52]KIW96702.1 hypothetical protein Z519_02093 [Cladophialophora bantiana CBS 173.52]